MPTIYKYQKITDAYTTYILAEPDYELLGLEDRITELCAIDGVTYISVPDGITLPEQPEQITVEEVALTDELKAAICAASPHVQLIDERVVMKIREKYSVNDEIKLIRLGASDDFTDYNDYVETCRAWGTAAKARLGV
jgi:hypothetical protein